MAPGKTLCLNMIVKNETANLARCLAALAGHIDCWVIGDTGSSDGTQDFIRNFFASRGVPGELHSFPFENFEQARNAALDLAYASPLAFDYMLFCDADMELVVEDSQFRARLAAPGYRVVQRSDALTYWNTRLLRRDCRVKYRGVTHEYLDGPDGINDLVGVWYRDYANGSNRVDKFERDIRLLEAGLREEPDNHRYWFYLAQSLRDAGRLREAADTYAKRAEMGGWDEEAWSSRLQEARCLLRLGDEAGFLRSALAAYNARPQRAEPLYDLAKFYREKGMNAASVLFSEPGQSLTPPPDRLFMEHYVYTAGLKEEFSIAANYSRDTGQKARGHAACESLALSRSVPAKTRDLARWNLYYYLEPAKAVMPSFASQRIAFTAPDGWKPTSPSVARQGRQLYLVQGCVNDPADGTPAATRNFLLRLTDALAVASATEILPPPDLPPASGRELEFADARVFAWKNGLWSISNGRCEPVLARIDLRDDNSCHLADWRVLRPAGEQGNGKHWLPLVADGALRSICQYDPTCVVDEAARTLFAGEPSIAADGFRGGTQAIEFDDGWLTLVHEVSTQGDKPHYQHRFAWLDSNYALRKVSRRFFFESKAIETAAGLAWHPDERRLLISYGVDDAGACLATVEADDVRRALGTAQAASRDEHSQSASVATDSDESRRVRSFDLFDSLIARRCVHAHDIFSIVEQQAGLPGFATMRVEAERQIFSAPYTLDDIYRRLVEAFGISSLQAERLKQLELSTESDNLFPILEHCRMVRPGDLIVSDMYLPQPFLQKILSETCNLAHSPLLVSSHGKRSGEVWQEIKRHLDIEEHLGDNPVTDLEVPRKHGINARLTSISRRTEIETLLADSGCAPLANVIREARLTSWHDDKSIRHAQLAQIEYNVPFLFLSSLRFIELLHRHGWSSVLFSARDCFLMSLMFDRLSRTLQLPCVSHYFYTSRLSRAHPSPTYLRYLDSLRADRKSVIVDLCGTGWSLARLLEQGSMSDTDLFLIHRIALPQLMERYRQLGGISEDVPVHCLLERAPIAGDNDVLEELNRALHPMVMDMAQVADKFLPIYSDIQYSAAELAIIELHHQAFMHALDVADRLRKEDCLRMMSAAGTELIEALYRRIASMMPHVAVLMQAKRREEQQFWKAIEKMPPVSA
jgi:glycosyltransferase involved in cell wall biosynthesis